MEGQSEKTHSLNSSCGKCRSLSFFCDWFYFSFSDVCFQRTFSFAIKTIFAQVKNWKHKNSENKFDLVEKKKADRDVLNVLIKAIFS